MSTDRITFPFDRENDKALEWEETSKKHIVKNKWIDFKELSYRLPDGTVFEPFYSYSRKDYVVIVPFDEEGKLICVRQFRPGTRQVTTEFPAGGIERKDGKEFTDLEDRSNNEDALEAAKRELTEETGYEGGEWKHLITIPGNVSIADNYAHVYMATGCKKISGQKLDDTEFLNVYSLTPEQLDDLIKTGGFQQSVHVMAWLMTLRNR